MSSSTNDPNAETTSSNTAAIKENLSYIEKFGLPAGVAQHIDSRLILNDVHIDNPTIASNIELNSWVLNCLESYQLDPSLVVHMMLEVFRDEFHGWGYMEFSRLDRHIRGALKETFMAKGIYMGRPSGPVNQHLANLVIDEQLPIWDKNDLLKYKTMYPTSKAWVLLELRHSHPPQQLTPSIEVNINPIDDRRQQTFTPRPAHVTPDPANALGSTPLTEALLAKIPLVQAPPTPAATSFKKPLTAIDVGRYNIRNRRNDHQSAPTPVSSPVPNSFTSEIRKDCECIPEHSTAPALSTQAPPIQALLAQTPPAEVSPIQAPRLQVPPVLEPPIQLSPTSAPLAPRAPVEHGREKPGKPPERVNIVDAFTDGDTDAKLSEYPASRQEKIAGPLAKDVFMVVTLEEFVTPDEDVTQSL